MAFTPDLKPLPPAQLSLWPDLVSTPRIFTLYGGTALALRPGHRSSVDFDFFSNATFDPARLLSDIPYLANSEIVQAAPNTLTCRVTRGGPVLVSFFGSLGLGKAAPPEVASGPDLPVASLLDIGGTNAAVVQKRAETKDYLDIDALIRNGVSLAELLAAGKVVYGGQFNPLITLKALSYFDDLPNLPADVKARLTDAVKSVDVNRLPFLLPFEARP